MKTKILTLLLSIICALPCLSQPYCDVQTFTIRDGLAANTISSFVQTGNGLMWFSTWNGLCCYDGYRFATFRNEPGTDVLTSNRLMDITPSATNDVWCCTYDMHVYLFDTRDCRFIDVGGMIEKKYGVKIKVRKVYSLANGHTWVVSSDGQASYRIDDSRIKTGEGIERFSVSDGNLRENGIKKIVLDDDGREWVIGSRMVTLPGSRFDSNVSFEHLAQAGKTVYLASIDGRVCAYRHGGNLRTVELPREVTRINAMLPLGKDRMLFATNTGVVTYDINRHTCKVYSVQNPSQPSPEATAIFVDSKQRVWAYTVGNGVTMIDTVSGVTSWLTSRVDNTIWQTVSEKPFFHEDNYGTVWIVPVGGTFSYYDEAGKRLVAYTMKSGNMSAQLPNITKYGTDRERNVWFTGTRNLHLVNFRYHHFKKTPVMPNQEVRALLIDSSGRTWAGTANGQLAVFDKQRRLLGYINSKGQLQAGQTDFSYRVYTLCEDSLGRVWVGTKGRGLYIIKPDGGMEHFVSKASDKYSLSHDDIYDIDIDNRGRVWVASFAGGLNLVDERQGRVRFINCRNELSRYPMDKFGKIRRVTHTADGTMLLSTSGGLVTFSADFRSPSDIRFYTSVHIMGDTTSLMANDVMQTLVTRSGRILVVSLGGGVQQIEANPLGDNLKFQDLPDVKPGEGIIQSIAEDNKGNIWMMRESTIDKYDISTGKLFRYGPGNIGDDIELSEAKPVYNPRTDVISVAAWGGFVSFNSSELKNSVFRPDIMFTGVLYQGDNKMEPILNKQVLTVPSDRRNLTVYFAALEYSDKYLMRYAYKLDGVDSKWNYVGAANSASFNHLPAGKYRLLVKSTNSDGIWMDNVAGLDIHVRPVFWETIWAKLLYILLFCGAIYVLIYIYTLRAKAAMERELSEMKTRFFTEISHKLRTPLTLIGGPVTEVLEAGGLSDAARRHLEMVQRNAMQMLRLVNRMLKYAKQVYINEEAHASSAGVSSAGVRIEDGDVSDATAAAMPIASSSDADIMTMDSALTDIADRKSPAEKLLVVEDNADLRAFLVSILSPDYVVLQADNGQNGLDIAEREMPDFIITDVMMPVMDGLTMVHHIKQNKDICHIPIIVLSAKASLEDRLQGLSEGIDDYITKPFSALYLKSRVSNIIRQRHLLQQNYVTQLKPDDHRTYKLDAPQIVDADNEMMKKLMDYLEKRINDPTLKIEDLADAVHLGRTVFYGKIKSIVGMTPVDFVRHIRMQRAEELVANSNYPFSQIAYMVGFSDPKYFGKCFKKETGMTPSEYREKAKAG